MFIILVFIMVDPVKFYSDPDPTFERKKPDPDPKKTGPGSLKNRIWIPKKPYLDFKKQIRIRPSKKDPDSI